MPSHHSITGNSVNKPNTQTVRFTGTAGGP